MTGLNASRVGIIAAMPGELAPLVKGWTRVASAKNIHHWERDAIQKDGNAAKWIAVCAGIGRDAATRAFAAAEKDGPLAAVLSIGWAGSLRAENSMEQTYAIAQVTDSRTGEQFQLVTSKRNLRLVTAPRVADVQEKSRLAKAYPDAVLVDMEAATVARLASMRGIPMYCCKAISDTFAEQLPDLNPFIDAHGQFQTARFVRSVLLRPRNWASLKTFGNNSKKAANLLARDVTRFLEDEEYLREYR